MRVSDVFPSKYIKASDLNGRTVRVTIDRFEIETIGQGQQQDRKPVLYFKGKEKGLVLNKTNATNIEMMHGPDIEDWVGCDVELFPSMVDFQGRSVEAVRCRPVRPQKQNAQQTQQTAGAAQGAGLSDDIPFIPCRD
jgi:hypothetical protein